ncbi:MAG: aminomethyl transferase family protein, partial [Chloroflexi bacterium]
QRAGGVHAGRRVHPRSQRGARFLGSRRLLRSRPRGRGRHGTPRRRVDRGRAAWPRRVGDGFPPLRKTLRQPSIHAGPDSRGLLHLLRREIPRPRTQRRPAAAGLPRLREADGARSRVRREIGVGEGQLVRAQRLEWKRVVAPARLGWAPVVPRHRGGASGLPGECGAEIRGQGAAAYLESLSDNHVARGVGVLTYTQMLNDGGGIECDFTVTRLADDRFRVITGTAFGQHDLAWIRDHAPGDGSVQVEDVTSAYGCIGLWGPAARRILQPLTLTDLGNATFPYMTARELAVGSVPCLALRVTYVGELGWELYCPSEFGQRLWDTLWEAGRDHGLVAGGYKAVDSLRLEKGYRVWGSDIGPEANPYQAGLGFCVKLDKGDFAGRRALLRARESPAATRLACLVLDDPRSVALGSEPVRVAGDTGRVTSGGFGYSVGRSIAYAYVPGSAPTGSPVEVEIFGSWVSGHISDEPLFDPTGARIRV